MDIYVVQLAGQGDLDIKAVSKEVFDWVNNPQTPGRKGKELSWDDDTPAQILADYHKEYQTTNPIRVTIGSYVNDRALQAPSLNGSAQFFDLKSFMNWFRKNGANIIDTYEGYIY